MLTRQRSPQLTWHGMKRLMPTGLLALTLVLSGCSSTTKTEGGPVMDGAESQACLDLWSQRVEEWNELTKERDATGAAIVTDKDGNQYEDWEAYATSKGWEHTYDELCE